MRYGNPHRDREGLIFEDPDGYRVVLQQEARKDGL
ncbi:hypothetical protein [Cupriavidus sp. BIC8F]